MQEAWLVRSEKNIISGPYSREKVVQMVQGGELGLQDEVCQANQYWFALYEQDEVARQLGIEVPKSSGGGDEVTATDLRANYRNLGGLKEPDMPEVTSDAFLEVTSILTPSVSTAEAEATEGAAPWQDPAIQDQLAGRKSISDPDTFYKPVVLRTVEQVSFWRFFALFLALGVAGGVIGLLWILQSRP